MPFESKPPSPVLQGNQPPHTNTYKVADGDNWWTIARRHDMDVWDLIYLNFQTRKASEVNWYLHHHVGCTKMTTDKKNWMFSSAADPGIIYVPIHVIEMPPMVVEGKVPSKYKTVWAGLGKAHSGDFFIIGSHDVTGKIYCLGDETPDIKNVVINLNGWKFGAGLGGSISAVFIIAHGYETAGEMNGVSDTWDFDVACSRPWVPV